MFCQWGCLLKNNLIHCEEEKCKQTTISDVLQCRLDKYDLYYNAGYRAQLECLKAKYIAYHPSTPNSVIISLT